MKKKLDSSLVTKVLENPILLQKLADKVYKLMLEDVRKQRERLGNYRR